jgi:hypothetical protein
MTAFTRDEETARPNRPLLWRYLPVICLTIFLAGMSVLFLLGHTAGYSTIFWRLGVDSFAFPFLDIHGLLAATECHWKGIDVFAVNPCDVLGRPHDYSPLLLQFRLTTEATEPLGFAVGLLFLASLLFLPASRGWPEAITLTLAFFSSAVLLAIERANIDLPIFVMAVVAANASMRSTAWRMTGYALITLAALAKFYPAVMLLLAMRERLVLLLTLAFITVALTILFVALEGTDIARAVALIPVGLWFNSGFGAQNLPRGIAALVLAIDEPPPSAALSIELAFAAVSVIGSVAIAMRTNLQACLDHLTERHRVFLLIGCVLLVACFFTAENAIYRCIYFLLVLPALTMLWRAPIAPTAQRLFVLTGLGILFLMWNQFFRHARLDVVSVIGLTEHVQAPARFCFWVFRELMWWWVITILLAMLLCLVWRTQSTQQALRIFFNARQRAALQLESSRHSVAGKSRA